MNKKIKNLIITSGLTLGLVLFLAPVVRAVDPPNLANAFGSQLSTVGSRSGFNTNQRSVDPIIATVISVILSFLGVIFLILMVYGGYIWMMAAGNDEKVTKAKDLIKAAIIGLLIVVGAYAITIFVMARISKDLIPETGGISDGGSYNPNTGSIPTGTTGTTDTGTVAGGSLGCCIISNLPPQANSCFDIVDDPRLCQGTGSLYKAYGGSVKSCDDIEGCPGYKDTTVSKVGCCYNKDIPSCYMSDSLEACADSGEIGLVSFTLGKSCNEVSDCTWGCCVVNQLPPKLPFCLNVANNNACTGTYPDANFQILTNCAKVAECN